jgi:hypothetical protein
MTLSISTEYGDLSLEREQLNKDFPKEPNLRDLLDKVKEVHRQKDRPEMFIFVDPDKNSAHNLEFRRWLAKLIEESGNPLYRDLLEKEELEVEMVVKCLARGDFISRGYRVVLQKGRVPFTPNFQLYDAMLTDLKGRIEGGSKAIIKDRKTQNYGINKPSFFDEYSSRIPKFDLIDPFYSRQLAEQTSRMSEEQQNAPEVPFFLEPDYEMKRYLIAVLVKNGFEKVIDKLMEPGLLVVKVLFKHHHSEVSQSQARVTTTFQLLLNHEDPQNILHITRECGGVGKFLRQLADKFPVTARWFNYYLNKKEQAPKDSVRKSSIPPEDHPSNNQLRAAIHDLLMNSSGMKAAAEVTPPKAAEEVPVPRKTIAITPAEKVKTEEVYEPTVALQGGLRELLRKENEKA